MTTPRVTFDIWFSRVGSARPFLKWAGGKQPFLQRYGDRLPDFSGRYVEPFLGSGSVFFEVMRRQVRPCQAILGDNNLQLIKCFEAVRDNPFQVSEGLKVLAAGFEAATDRAGFFYEQRLNFNLRLPRVDPPLFIFLNKACWNGLYRVNQKGHFNVPYGNPRNGLFLPDLDQLEAASAALALARLRATSWENTLAQAASGDFVFLDPPYFSDTKVRQLKYQRRLFSYRDHVRLAHAVAKLASRGIKFMLTNSGEDEMVSLYEELGLRVERVDVPRPINARMEGRGAAPEVIVTSQE